MLFETHRSPFGSSSSILTIELSSKHKSRILLDVGLCFEEQSDKYLEYLTEIAPTIDAVLLSSGLLTHCGALPFIEDQLKDSCKIYACLPAAKLGKLTCVDFLLDSKFCADPILLQECGVKSAEKSMSDTEKKFYNLYSREDIEKVFSRRRIQVVSWGELITIGDTASSPCVSKAGHGTAIQAFPAGHCLSSTLWKVTCLENGQSVVYAPRIGSVEGNFICRPFTHEPIMRQCEMLILESRLFQRTRENENARILAKPASYEPGFTEESNQPFNHFLEKIIETLFIKKGNVLIPTDPGDQMVGIIVLLNSIWKLKGFENHPIALLSHSAKSFVGTVKCLTNYANDAAQNDIFNGKENPLDFVHSGQLIPIESMDEFNHRVDANTPTIVLATPRSMQYGFSQELLMRFGKDSANCILFDSPPATGSVAHQLIEAPARQAFAVAEGGLARTQGPPHTIRNIHFFLKHRVGTPASSKADEVNEAPDSPEKLQQADQINDAQPAQVEGDSPSAALDGEPTAETADTFVCPTGVYMSHSSKEEIHKGGREYPSADSSSCAYGALISTKLLDAWGIEHPVYFAGASPASTSYDSTLASAGQIQPFASTDLEHAEFHRRSIRHRYAFTAHSYESYKVSLKVAAEICLMNLENFLSLEHLGTILHKLPGSLQKCCILGKIPLDLKRIIDGGGLLPPAKLWYTEKPLDAVTLRTLPISTTSIDRGVFEKGIRYGFQDPIWEIIILSGAIRKADGVHNLLTKLHQGYQTTVTAFQLEQLSTDPVSETDKTYFVGESSLPAILEALRSSSIKVVSNENSIMANDMSMITVQNDTLKTEEVISLDSLAVRDALMDHYVQI
ncbi:cleavage and polyadenylation specificity factor [Perkinsela sp. CCAP 1560/4]|nr:cleavage and polyadenylation specificity factor [Perkinsela sp. CCAP 1560/4]|eukprot:KNH08376.1 cleavage and polyadenylation specificity factor [Perkinsela sp. CCAP 1560/4]